MKESQLLTQYQLLHNMAALSTRLSVKLSFHKCLFLARPPGANSGQPNWKESSTNPYHQDCITSKKTSCWYILLTSVNDPADNTA